MACLSPSLLVMSRAPETCKTSENQSCSGASTSFIFAFFPKEDFCTRPQGLLSSKSILSVPIPLSDPSPPLCLEGWRRVCGSSLCCPPLTPSTGCGTHPAEGEENKQGPQRRTFQKAPVYEMMDHLATLLAAASPPPR